MQPALSRFYSCLYSAALSSLIWQSYASELLLLPAGRAESCCWQPQHTSRGRQPQPAALPKLFSGTPLLLCSFCCTCREGCALLLAGTMDGSVLLLDTNSGDLLQQMRPHQRYCVSVAWSPDGQHFASAAWDDTVGIHLCTGSRIKGSQAPSQPQVEPRGSVQEGGESLEAQMQTLASIPYTQHVNCVVFLPGGRQIAAAVKESVYLRLIDMDTMKVTLMHPCCCNSAPTFCTHLLHSHCCTEAVVLRVVDTAFLLVCLSNGLPHVTQSLSALAPRDIWG